MNTSLYVYYRVSNTFSHDQATKKVHLYLLVHFYLCLHLATTARLAKPFCQKSHHRLLFYHQLAICKLNEVLNW